MTERSLAARLVRKIFYKFYARNLFYELQLRARSSSAIKGLPEDWSGHVEPAGSFGRKGELPRVAPNVTLHKGWFKNTIDSFKKDNPGKIAFLHVDCDRYSSTRDVLWHLADRLRRGRNLSRNLMLDTNTWQ